MGAGTRSCGEWLQYRSNNQAMAYQLVAWIVVIFRDLILRSPMVLIF
jgi:hypothetical protein